MYFYNFERGNGMGIKSENPSPMRLIVAAIGGTVFFLLNCLFPYLNMLFSYLEGDITHYWPTEVSNGVSINYSDWIDLIELSRGESKAKIFWQLIDIWQWILLLGGLAALVLVILPPLFVMRGTELETPVDLGLLGFIIGLIASGIEWLLFILAWQLEDWVTSPDLGFILLILNFVGFVVLYLAAKPSILVAE